jgi:hypothetical protein
MREKGTKGRMKEKGKRVGGVPRENEEGRCDILLFMVFEFTNHYDGDEVKEGKRGEGRFDGRFLESFPQMGLKAKINTKTECDLCDASEIIFLVKDRN